MGMNNSKERVGTIVSRLRKVGSNYEAIKSYDTGFLVFDNYKSFCIWARMKFKLPYCFGIYGVTVIADGVKLSSYLEDYKMPSLIELRYNNMSEMFILAL